MKSKVVFHRFDPVIYPYKIWISVTQNFEAIAERFTEKNGNNIDILEYENSFATTTDVRCKISGCYGTLINFESRNAITFKTVTHESSHAAKDLFNHIGADARQHETFEYVAGFIAECCGKVKINRYD